MDVSVDDEVVVYSINYYEKLGKLLSVTMKQDMKVVINYAIWRLMKSFLPFLDGEYGVKRAKFRKVLYGIIDLLIYNVSMALISIIHLLMWL